MNKNTRTFRLAENQFIMLREISQNIGKSQGRIIEDMISALYGIYIGNSEVFKSVGKQYENEFELIKKNQR